SLKLTAGCRGNRSVFDQNHRVRRKLVVPSHITADRLNHVVPFVTSLTLHLAHNHEPFLSLVFDGECDHSPLLDPWTGVLDGHLNVLRIAIDPPNNNQILQPSGDIELTLMKKP